MTYAFAHLRVHSDYSLGSGASKVSALVSTAKKNRHPAMALTDVRNLHGALAFSKEASSNGIQPLVGAQLYLKVGSESMMGSIILLAQNAVGYANICRLANLSVARARQPEGSIDTAVIQEILASQKTEEPMTDGIIAIGGVGADGFLRTAFKAGMDEEASTKFVRFIANRFPGRFYLEICRNGYPDAEDIEHERRALGIALSCDIPIVATTDVWYADPSRHGAYEILQAVGAETITPLEVEDGGIKATTQRRFHLRDADEMKSLFDDLPEAFENASLVARRCAFKAEGRKPILPKFTSEGEDEAEEMRRQAHAGLRERFRRHAIPEEKHAEYLERLEYELGIIERMGFPGYFLIVSDFIKWAKSRDIPVGPGRGSGAGSVVAWALTITDLDPLRFGLLFERFLNPDRVSMPDFDIDFCQDRREEVIQYVKEKYGSDRVAQIATFSEIKSKTAIRDVARVLVTETGMLPPHVSNEISKLIPNKEGGGAEPAKLEDAIKLSSEFREAINEKPAAKTVFKHALSVEGLSRNAGMHAAGVVIAGDVLTKLVPVGFDPKSDMAVTNFNMKDAETAGLVKFDFLGLKTLSVIKEAVKLIKETTGEDIDIENQPYDDPAVYKMLQDGMSNGVFQLESDGMKRVLRQIRPTTIEDLIAIVSLFRPGPMEMIPTYAERKNSGLDEDSWYPEPVDQTKRFLGETFGIMVYQEQVMQVAQVVAGYSLGEADLLRRAMGKKIKEEMAKQKAKFIEGAEARGTPAKKADELFDLIDKFSGYGFNKSHAAAYAAISYQTAWLKRHYPAQFFSAAMTYEIGGQKAAEKMSLIKHDMDLFGIPLFPPDINHSHMRFRPEQGENGVWGVRFALSAIKQVTPNEAFMAARAKGPFKSLEDFSARAGDLFTSSQIEKLAQAGTFECITPEKVRRRAYAILTFLAKNGKAQKDKKTMSMFEELEADIVIPQRELKTEEWPDAFNREFDSVGFYFKGHPLDNREEKLKIAGGIRTRQAIVDFMKRKGLFELMDRKLRGMVEKVEMKDGKSGKKRIDLRLGERDDSYIVRIFYLKGGQEMMEVFYKLQEAAKSRTPVIVVSKFSAYEDGFSIYGDRVYTDDEYMAEAMTMGSMEIVIDTSLFKLEDNRKARAALEEINARAQMRSADPEALLDEAAAVVRPRFDMTLAAIKGTVEACKSDDPKATAITIRSVTRVGTFSRVWTVELPDRYTLDMTDQNFLRHLDGVSSIQEADEANARKPVLPANRVSERA